MNVYKFENTIKNTQIWPRYFVAFSLPDAIVQAKRFQILMNEVNMERKDLMLSLDFDGGIIVKTKRKYYRRGYIELNGS